MSIELKQIVYNLEDYGGSGGLISTNKNNHNELIYSTVYQNNENDSTETTLVGDLGLTDYLNNRIDIFSTDLEKNFLKNYTNIKKIGIQAPPGTKFTFSESPTPNASQWLMVGRTGIYELNDDIVIKSLRFQRPKNYILNKELSQELQSNGTSIMKQARDEFLTKVTELTKSQGTVPDRTETGNDYWIQYNNLHQQYVTKYRSGLGLYLKGKAGVYVDGSEDDLYNIIIDFTYGEEEG